MNTINTPSEHVSCQDFCRFLSVDSLTSAAETLYIEAEANGELLKVIPIERIPKYFPILTDVVTEAAQQIMADPMALRYTNFLRVSYFQLNSTDIPFLQPEEGNVMRNFAPALSILDHTASMEAEMQRRKIDDLTAERVRNIFELRLINRMRIFGYYGIPKHQYFWNKHFLIPDIFPIDNLEFEVTGLPNQGTYFIHKDNGHVMKLIDIEETETAYIGHPVKPGGDPDQCLHLSKQEYRVCMERGEDVISVHIPVGTKLDAQTCARTYQKALEFLHKAFPEKNFKAFYCGSWLMSAQLQEILPETSNILSFQRFYHTFPVRSSGKELFTFVHPKPFERYEDLPENTTLERGIKKRYLENRPIYVYSGIHMINDGKL